jgi:rod shape-determining protein MreC
MIGQRRTGWIMDWLKRFRLLFAVLFFLSLAAFILAMNSRSDRETSLVQKTLLQISFPFQQKIQGFILWLRGVGKHYIFLTRTQQENEALQRMVSTLREENNRLQEAVLAHGRLEKLYPLQARHPSSSSILAQVFARDPSSWFKSLLVDKGESEGVSRDMAVVVSEGVVGRVIDVSATTAKVLLVSDPNSAVDVIIQRSRAQGIMEGRVGEFAILKYVQKGDDVEVGDKVITSGLGGTFPRGLLIATVTKVERKRPGVFQYVEVTPTVDFSRLEEVLILEVEP